MKKIDVGIVGGGLAGLSLSILLAKQGFEVALFEKNQYPFHRVCGEYISLESYDFLVRLGLPMDEWSLPIIKQLAVSSPKGTLVEQALPLGGFGISRHKLDFELVQLAKACGVQVYEGTVVENVDYQEDKFFVKTQQTTFEAKQVVASYGKKSNLDLVLKRDFVQSKPNKLNNFVGIKYHIKTDFRRDGIVLHNFRNGYCGMSAIENDQHCLCYLTTAQNLKQSGGIKAMEEQISMKNPFLKHIFSNSEFLFDAPVTISQVSFEQKPLVENHILMVGDSAGMITPLCGNGMSMALHGALLAGEAISLFLSQKLNRQQLENQYITDWKKHFETRLKVGRLIQSRFGNELQTEILVRSLKPFPFITKQLIKLTHGKKF